MIFWMINSEYVSVYWTWYCHSSNIATTAHEHQLPVHIANKCTLYKEVVCIQRCGLSQQGNDTSWTVL